MSDPPRTPPSSHDDHGAVISELMAAQLRAARAEVFSAWLQARDKANRLAQEDGRELPDRRGAA